jgi:hypothetical protein
MSMNIFLPLSKVDSIEGIIYATAALEEPDRAGEIFDYGTSKPHFEKWSEGIAKATDGKSVGNVRAMHSNISAGKVTSIAFDDESKKIDVVIKINDANELKKLADGNYTGVSIGGKYAKRWPDEGDKKLTRYTAEPSEISIVDLPCMPGATFSCVKDDGSTEMRKFHVTEPPLAVVPSVETPPAPEYTGPEQVWKAKDGQTFGTKALAKAHDDEVTKSAAPVTPASQLAAALDGLKGDVAKLGDPAAIAKKDFTDEERKKLASSGEAMSDGSYPIQNTSDLKNAIQAFGRAKDKKGTKAHIKTRAKALGAENELPDSWKDGADKACRFGDLRKGLETVARLACLIQELDWLQSSTEYEATYEQDNSTVPESLKQNIATLSATLRAMVEEETNELLDHDEAIEFGELLEMSAAPKGHDALVKTLGAKAPSLLAKAGMRHGKSDAENLAKAHDAISAMGVAKCSGMGKAGARHSKADAQHLLDAHNSLCKAGADCPAKDEPKEEDDAEKLAAGALAKALGEEKNKTAELEKTMSETVAAITELRAQVAKFAKVPMPRPHERNTIAVTKGDPESPFALLAKLSPEERNEVLKEYALSLPRNPR